MLKEKKTRGNRWLWRIQKECLKKPVLRLEDGDSDHRLKPTGTRSGCQSHRDRSFPYHPRLVAPDVLVARGAIASFPPFLSEPRVPPMLALPCRQPRSGCPQTSLPRRAPSPLSPLLPRDSRAQSPGCQRGIVPSLRPHLGDSGFLPSFLPFPGAERAAREPSRRLPRRPGRAAAPARCLLPRRSGTATGDPRPCPSRGAPHSPRRARRAASATWGW